MASGEHDEGLKAATGRRHFQGGASWQRCQLRYARNLPGMAGAKKRRKEPAEGLRGGFAAAPSRRRTALALASELAHQWREKGPEKVAEHLEEHVEGRPSCLAFPEGDRRRTRTTSGPERLNQEIKRRTGVARIFPKRRACLRGW